MYKWLREWYVYGINAAFNFDLLVHILFLIRFIFLIIYRQRRFINWICICNAVRTKVAIFFKWILESFGWNLFIESTENRGKPIYATKKQRKWFISKREKSFQTKKKFGHRNKRHSTNECFKRILTLFFTEFHTKIFRWIWRAAYLKPNSLLSPSFRRCIRKSYRFLSIKLTKISSHNTLLCVRLLRASAMLKFRYGIKSVAHFFFRHWE